MKLTDEQIRSMLKDVIGEVDYDIAKSYNPRLSEDPESAELSMRRLVQIVRTHLKDSMT